jgi:hypothetical protein
MSELDNFWVPFKVIVHMSPLKTSCGERAVKPISDRLKRLPYLSRVDFEKKIKSRRQNWKMGKNSFVDRSIQHWKQLPDEVL